LVKLSINITNIMKGNFFEIKLTNIIEKKWVEKEFLEKECAEIEWVGKEWVEKL
jgi:hypothetical protein